jgi:ABC-type Mn2+/Zn2+ transport system ATPase subunit
LSQYFTSLFAPGVAHHDGASVVEATDLTVAYGGKTALENLSFHVVQGERMAVVGPNGAGKSTLLRAVAGLVPFSLGKVTVYGHAPGGHICISYVPQRSGVDWSFPVSVFDVVMMGRTRKIGLFRWPGRKDREHVRQCLELVGMADLAGRQIGKLSGGQQQRVFIAQALAQEAQLVLMDEPLTGLDVPTQEDLFRILDELRHHHVTVMLSTHDLNQAAGRFDRVMLLNRCLLSLGPAHEVLTLENLASAYGSHMRLLVPVNGMAPAQPPSSSPHAAPSSPTRSEP